MHDESTTVELTLTNGQVILIDAADYEWISQHKWSPCGINQRYICRSKRAHETGGKWVPGAAVYLHREIMKPQGREMVDHINQNGWDNRRSNLRIATKSQNMANKPKIRSNTSGYKGVSMVKKTGKWRARTNCNGREYTIGYFDNPEDAARAYDRKVIELFGDFAYLNFPENH